MHENPNSGGDATSRAPAVEEFARVDSPVSLKAPAMGSSGELDGQQKDRRNESPPTAHMGYRVEYQDSTTGHVLDSKHGSRPPSVPSNSGLHPFEEVTIYKVRPSRGGNAAESEASSNSTTTAQMYPGAVPPRRLLRIFSVAIINALQTVVEYYPSQDLTGDLVEVPWPYPILAHHYEELSQFAKECAAKEPDSLCDRERDAPLHIKLLLQYLDSEIMDGVRREQERNEQGFYTFEWYWVGQRPGTTILQRIVEDKNLERLVVHSVTGGTFEHPPTSWGTKYWNMEFDGQHVGCVFRDVGTEGKFDGEKALNSDTCRFVGFGENVHVDGKHGDIVKELIEEGKIYWRLLKKQCMFHSGKARQFPYNKVSVSLWSGPR